MSSPRPRQPVVELGTASEIPDKLYFKIGEVSRLVGVEAHVLRYWEREVPAIRPGKSTSNQRRYRRRDVEMFREIKRLLYEERYTLAGARRRVMPGDRAAGAAALDDEAPGPGPGPGVAHDADTADATSDDDLLSTAPNPATLDAEAPELLATDSVTPQPGADLARGRPTTRSSPSQRQPSQSRLAAHPALQRSVSAGRLDALATERNFVAPRVESSPMNEPVNVGEREKFVRLRAGLIDLIRMAGEEP